MRAFFDPNTRVLKCFGRVKQNEPGDIYIDVSDDFSFEIGRARLDENGKIVPYEPPPPPAPRNLYAELDELKNRMSGKAS